MIALSADIRFLLRAANIARRVAERDGEPTPDPMPAVKLFNPLGPEMWLATELDPDGDTLFGLVDLGFGHPELASFSLSEIAQIRLRSGLAIELDPSFVPLFRISVWAALAHRSGSIARSETLLAWVA